MLNESILKRTSYLLGEDDSNNGNEQKTTAITLVDFVKSCESAGIPFTEVGIYTVVGSLSLDSPKPKINGDRVVFTGSNGSFHAFSNLVGSADPRSVDGGIYKFRYPKDSSLSGKNSDGSEVVLYGDFKKLKSNPE